MPIYVVRWLEPMVSLVSARDEEELKYRLDDAADPGGCTWQIYKGPDWRQLVCRSATTTLAGCRSLVEEG